MFLLAAALGAVIAYHPRTRAKASTLPELEQPKTFIMYALVGAVIAKIVEANSAMAFVVFGIGGLMRFRTDVGPAKDTGRVILTAVVGVCCGLKLLVVAVMATGVRLGPAVDARARDLHPAAGQGPAPRRGRRLRPRPTGGVLVQRAVRILGERKKIIEGQVDASCFATPDPFDRERFEQQFAAGDSRDPARRARLGRVLGAAAGFRARAW